MRKLGLIFALAFLFSTTGCQLTKEWVVQTAKDVAVQVVDTQIEKFNNSTVVPAFSKVEERLGEKIDKNDDGVWDQTELESAIAKQIGPVIADAQKVLLDESGKSINEKMKDLATKEDGMKGLLLLVVAWVLSKLGIKIGPKGLQKLGEILTKKKVDDSETKVQL